MIDVNQIKKSSDAVEAKCSSGSMCMAKFYQSTIHFQLGKTHSCYHLPHHAIPLSQLATDTAAFHNTKIKSDERNLMKSGIRPQGCNYCWNIEDLKGEQYSDRQMWNWYFTRDADNNLTSDLLKLQTSFVPRYLEVSFGNECNMNCGYCHPQHSSKFHAEIVQHGPYDVDAHKCNVEWFKVYKESENPYLDKWWPYWETIKNDVKVLRVTGGEPLIQKSTYRLIESVVASNLSDLELDFNSNMSMPSEIVSKFIGHTKNLVNDKKVKRLKLFASIDTWSKEAEYVRSGLKLPLFEKNIHKFLSETDYEVNFMITYNIFSVPNFKLLLEKVLKFREMFKYEHLSFHRVRFDVNYLREPIQFDFRLLPQDFLIEKLEESVRFLKSYSDDTSLTSFATVEAAKLEKVLNYVKENPMLPETQIYGRKQFVKFFDQYDIRKKINMQDYSSELAQMREEWRRQ